MAFNNLLKHRCAILRLHETNENGMPVTTWEVVDAGIKCYLDLNFIRKGKDPMWTPEAGRAADRSGVLFVERSSDIRSGDRVKMSKGPTGTFSVEGAVDEAWQPERLHHYELGVVEVAKALVVQP